MDSLKNVFRIMLLLTTLFSFSDPRVIESNPAFEKIIKSVQCLKSKIDFDARTQAPRVCKYEIMADIFGDMLKNYLSYQHSTRLMER